MADPAMPNVGDIVADKYEIVQLIGEGGMGSVFRARHRITGKQVALKWMLPELARNEDAVHRFLREAKAAGRIAHPNVVDIYDVGEHRGSYFLVMEYLRGEPLTKVLARGPLASEQIVDILLPCLHGVAAAHKKGVIHRDLKPDNIFLCRNDEGHYLQPKVLDFGISKLAGADNEINPRLTRTGAVMGTPYYMSPEQIRGSHDVDGRCDIYAFGVILYEALTGQVPFRAETYSALVLEIATGTPRMPRDLQPDLPEGLQTILMRAMARDPRDRYQDIMALSWALQPFAGSVRYTTDRLDPTGPLPHSHSTPRTSTPFSTDRSLYDVPGRRKSRLLVVAFLGLAMALGGGAWALMSSGKMPDPLGDASSDREAKPSMEPSSDSPPPAAAAYGVDDGMARPGPDVEDEKQPGVVPGVPPAGDSEAAGSVGNRQRGRDLEGPEDPRQDRGDVEAPDEAAALGDDDEAAVASPRSGPRPRPNRVKAPTPRPAPPADPSPSGDRPAATQPERSGQGRTGRLTVDDF